MLNSGCFPIILGPVHACYMPEGSVYALQALQALQFECGRTTWPWAASSWLLQILQEQQLRQLARFRTWSHASLY